MNCREFESLLADAVGDELSDDDRARFRSHMATCDVCGSEFASLASAVAQLGKLPAPPQVSIRNEGGRLVIGDHDAGKERLSPVPRHRPASVLRFAASILIAFTAGYGLHAGMMIYDGVTRPPVAAVDGGSRPEHDGESSVPHPALRDGIGHPSVSFRNALAAAHLAEPGKPALVKCLMAMSGGR